MSDGKRQGVRVRVLKGRSVSLMVEGGGVWTSRSQAAPGPACCLSPWPLALPPVTGGGWARGGGASDLKVVVLGQDAPGGGGAVLL